MEREHIYLVLATVLLMTWIFPAIVLTIKVSQIKGLSKNKKSQLIKPMWYVPLVGNLVCYMQFAEMGKLRPLNEGEHKSIWAAYSSTRK